MTSSVCDPVVSFILFVNWLMSPVYLATAHTITPYLDENLRLDIDVLLHLGCVTDMGPIDKRQALAILKTKSIVVEVDENAGEIRPIWAARSVLVLENVIYGDMYDVIFLLGYPIASFWMWSPDGYRQIPNLPLPAGIKGIQQISPTAWIAVFYSPFGAEAAQPNTWGKSIHGVGIQTHVLKEKPWEEKTAGDLYAMWTVFDRYFHSRTPPIPSGLEQLTPERGANLVPNDDSQRVGILPSPHVNSTHTFDCTMREEPPSAKYSNSADVLCPPLSPVSVGSENPTSATRGIPRLNMQKAKALPDVLRERR